MHSILTHDPVLQERPGVPYVGTRRSVSMNSMGVIADRIPELISWLLQRGHVPAGAPFLRYEIIGTGGQLVVEAGVPVSAALTTGTPADGEVHAATLPAGSYVVVTHRGHPESLIGATDDLLRWSEAQGVALDVQESAGEERWRCRLESYLTNPAEEPDPHRWESELAIRLAGR